MTGRFLPLWLLLIIAGIVRADGPRDNQAENVRPVPPKGIAVPDADRAALRAGVDELGQQIDALRESLRAKPALLRLLPDVQVYHKAVREALEHDEFFQAREIAVAKDLLKRGLERAGSSAKDTPRGTRPPGWSCAATSRRSTARSSRTAWSCRPRTGRIRRTDSGWMSGATGAARTSAS